MMPWLSALAVVAVITGAMLAITWLAPAQVNDTPTPRSTVGILTITPTLIP